MHKPVRDRAALVDELFVRFAARIASSPQKHEPYMAMIVVSKTRGGGA